MNRPSAHPPRWQLIIGLSVGLLCALFAYFGVQKLGDRESAQSPAQAPNKSLAAEKLQEPATLAAVIEYAQRYSYQEAILRPGASPTFYQFGVDEGPGIVPTLLDPETAQPLPFALFASFDQSAMNSLPKLRRNERCRPLVGYLHAELCRLSKQLEETDEARLIRLDLVHRSQA